MRDRPARKGLDTEIVQEVLTTLEEGIKPSPEKLSLRFPDREEEVRDVLRVLHSYQECVREARTARIVDTDDLLATGTTLGEFTIKGVLGRGAMCVVYRARQKSLGDREVALKVLPPALVARDPRFLERFHREAELASKVHHPNVAEVYGFGPGADSLFFAMRLVEGRTLHDVLSGLALQRRLGQGRHLRSSFIQSAVKVVRDLADALAAIHARNLVHRDVKPANILLEEAGEGDHDALAGRPVLVDFGLLRPVGQTDITGTRTLLGTPAFTSPESLLGRKVDATSDVFSLGAILHDLLTLTPPGERNPASAGLSKVEVLNPAVDAQLAAIVVKALEERPALRYADGGAFRDDLDRYLRNKPVRAVPATPIGRVRLWARRNPSRAVKAGAVGFVLLGILIASLWIGNRVIQLYSAATRGMDMEKEGRLLEAMEAYQPLIDHPTMARSLPRLKQACIRAGKYGSGNLSRVLGLLAANTEEAHTTAHGLMQGLLLTEGNRDLWEPILGFLEREIRNRNGSRQPWHRLLAAETAAYFLLIKPAPLRTNRTPGTWEKELEDTILEVSGNRKEQIELRHAAVSALSGMPGIRVFEILLPILEEHDLELRRLALTATCRIWWAICKEGALLDVPQGIWAGWINRILDSARDYTSPSRGRRDVFLFMVMNEFPYLAAWTRMELRRAGKLEPWDLPAPRIRYLEDVETVLHACRNGEEPESCRPDIPWLAALFDKWHLFFARPSIMYRHFNREENDDYAFENIWANRSRPIESVTVKGPARRDMSLARFDFTAEEPHLEGAAISATYQGAKVERTAKNPASRNVLMLTHPDSSRLSVLSTVPQDATGTEIRIRHCPASRILLPHQGRARIRVMTGNGKLLLECDLFDPWTQTHTIPVDPLILQGKTSLEICVKLVSTNTLYWIKSVEIHFRSVEKN